MKQFLLYGANGFTGRIIAEMAKNYELEPVLAGRSEEKLREVASSTGYSYEVVDLSETQKLEELLSGYKLVIHAAGPFIHTAKPMMNACLKTRTHYVDITGEIAVFEMAARLDKQAKDAGIILLPGGGFDVVPTDCMAKYLKEQLPDATDLKLAFAALGGGLSHGTAITMAENLGESGAVRLEGKIKRVPTGHKGMTVDFIGKSLFTMTIPWGDVSTAFYSTGIPNIETYMAVHPKQYRQLKYQRYFNWLLKTNVVRNFVKSRINKKPAGPSVEKREQAKSLVWGQVTNNEGKKVAARLIGPEGYNLTAMTALSIAKKVLSGNAPVGFQTPSNAYGADLIMELDGVQRELV